jgi:hypothetical protein
VDGNYNEKLLVVMMVLIIIPILAMVVVQADEHSPPFHAHHPSPLHLHHPPSPFSDSAGISVKSKLICGPKCLLISFMKVGKEKKHGPPSHDKETSQCFRLYYTSCMCHAC